MSETPPKTIAIGSHRHRTLTAGLVLFAGVCLGCWLTYDPLWVANDTTQALSVVRHLLSGKGVKTDIIYYEEQYATGQIPAPQTVFPPGFPVLIATATRLGLPISDAAYIVSSLCFAGVAVLLFWGALRMGQSLSGATLLSICWCGCVQCWNNTWVMMSEMPFITLTFLSLLLFPVGRSRSPRWLFASGCAAAGAFTVRYAGVFWFITVAGYFGVELLRRRQWIVLKEAITWGAVPLLTLTALFWRNHVLSGEWTGGNPLGDQRPFALSIWELYQSVALTLGWAKSRLLAGGGAELALAATCAFTTFWIIRNWQSVSVRPPGQGAAVIPPWIWLSGAYALVTVGLLVYLDTRSPVGLSPRKLLPLLPFWLLLVGGMLSRISINSSSARTEFTAIGLLLAAAIVWGQANVLSHVTTESHPTVRIARTLEASIDSETLHELLRRETSEPAPLLTNEPHSVNYLLERPVLGLPESDYSDRVWTEPEVLRIVEAYSVKHVALFLDVYAETTVRPPFFDRLAARDVPDWLQPMYVDDRLMLFAVRGEPTRRRHPVSSPDPVSLSKVSLDVPPPKDGE
jgi:hypothetical protein